MIRIDVERDDLEQMIEHHKPGWLDDADRRSYLFKRRAQLIYFLFVALQMVDHYTSPKSEHTNCLRCFHRLYTSDIATAESVAQDALALWATGSP